MTHPYVNDSFTCAALYAQATPSTATHCNTLQHTACCSVLQLFMRVLSLPTSLPVTGRMSHVTYERVVLHINESCLIQMSHVSYKWVMSHMNESCLIWMSHVSYEWVMSHMNESCLIWMRHAAYDWVMAHCCGSAGPFETGMRHVIYECVMSHMSRRVANQWVMSRMNESCPIAVAARGLWERAESCYR